MVFSGWRFVVAVLLGLVVLTLLIAVALWVAIALVVLGGLVWLNIVMLPRLSRRLHLPRLALDLICLALLAAAGWLLNGPTGLTLGALAWLAGTAGPRLAANRLAARAAASARRPTIIVVEPPAFRDRPHPGNTSAGNTGASY
jgi:hypothetical protein